MRAEGEKEVRCGESVCNNYLECGKVYEGDTALSHSAKCLLKALSNDKFT